MADSVALPSLDRSDVHLAAYTLDLLLDADHSSSEIDVLPAEAEHFAAAQAIKEKQDERRMKWIRLGNDKELPRLLRSPWPDGPSMPLGQLDQAGDVAGDQFVTYGAGERCAEDGAHDLHLANRVAFI